MQIAVFTGGESSEREVAFWSAKNVVSELEKVGFDVTVFDVPSELPKFLESRDQFSCVVPVLHGKGGEDGTIQGFLKTLKIPFIFSDVTACALAMDKYLAKAVVSVHGLKTPKAMRIRRQDVNGLTYAHPVVLKPIPGGSTLGVTIVRSSDELEPACREAFRFGEAALVENFIDGLEFTVPVIEDGGEARALDVIQIVSPSGCFTFEEKYIVGKMAGELCPAPIDDVLKGRLQEAAVTAHNAIGARHASRSDFIVDASGAIWFLEINTIPGMTAQSLITKALRAGGYDFGRILQQWIESVL